MKTEKKADPKEEISLIQYPYEVKGPRVYDQYPTIKPTKYYYCSTCGEIMAADILWKTTESGMQKPFCTGCDENPVTPIIYYDCPICGEIKAVDVIRKDTDDEMQKPFCKKCERPVVPVN